MRSNRVRWFVMFGSILLFGAVLGSCSSLPIISTPPTATPTKPDHGDVTLIVKPEGTEDVFDKGSGVVVRVIGTDFADTIDDDGKLILPSCEAGQFITVWAPGYYISTIPCAGGVQENILVTLKEYKVDDNAHYAWVEARNATDPTKNCAACHSGNSDTGNQYSEWLLSEHARSISDPYLKTMYLGTNVNGAKSPLTVWEPMNNDRVRRAPVMDGSYFGPGYKLDYPDDYGNCGFCHTPAAVTGAQLKVNLEPLFSAPPSAATEGINCDVCHKVLNVNLDQNGYPFVDRPGILSYEFLRSGDKDKAGRLYVGPQTDIDTRDQNIGITCSPVYSRSEFCAPCHYAKFWDTVIYNSYGEWKDSEYSKEGSDNYRTCQDCHMPQETPVTEAAATATPEGATPAKKVPRGRDACSEENKSLTDFNHDMMLRPANDLNDSYMIRGAATVKLNASYVPSKDWIEVNVTVNNNTAGHDFPTDSPLRHLILVVEAKDERGVSLIQADGDRIPNWGGTAFGQPGNYAGLAGTIYGNILLESDTNLAPTASYWDPTKQAWKIRSDTRLQPNKDEKSTYHFAAPESGKIIVTARLIYRYAFIDLMRQKGWVRPDLTVAAPDPIPVDVP